jgi:uncharacterized membrane protein YphA (DoxX/SURF4 family)
MPTDAPSAVTVRREPGPFTRSLVALVLRAGLGLMFVMVGLDKFAAIKAGKYPAMIVDQFAAAPLRPELVKLFADVLPYAEVALGGLILAGLFTTISAALAGVLLVHLLFGHLVLHKIDQLPSMMTYLLVDAAILWLSPVTSNYLSLDGLLVGWFWRPKAQGEYQRVDESRGSSSPRRM